MGTSIQEMSITVLISTTYIHRLLEIEVDGYLKIDGYLYLGV